MNLHKENQQKLIDNLIKLKDIIKDFAQQVKALMPNDKKATKIGGRWSFASEKAKAREEIFDSFIGKETDKISRAISNIEDASLMQSFIANLLNSRGYLGNLEDRGEVSLLLKRLFEKSSRLAKQVFSPSLFMKKTVDEINRNLTQKENWQVILQNYRLKIDFIRGVEFQKTRTSELLQRYLWENTLNFPEDYWQESWEKNLRDYLTRDLFPRLEALDFNYQIKAYNQHGKEQVINGFQESIPALKKGFSNSINWIAENDGNLDSQLESKSTELSNFFKNGLGIGKFDENKQKSLKEFFLRIREARKWLIGLGGKWKFFEGHEETKRYFSETKVQWEESNYLNFLSEVFTSEKISSEEWDKIEAEDFFSVSPLIFFENKGKNKFVGKLKACFLSPDYFRDSNSSSRENEEDQTSQNDNDSEDQETTNKNGQGQPPTLPTSEQLEEEAKKQAQQKSAQTDNQIKNALKDFQEAQTLAEKLKKIQEMVKNVEDQSFQTNQEEVEKAEKEVAATDPVQAAQSFLESLDQQMSENEITNPAELGSEISVEYEKLKSNAITEPNLMVETKHRISAKIGEMGSQKRFTELVDKIENTLRTGQGKKEVRQELISFLASTNIYDQALIAQEQKKLLELKDALASSASTSPPPEFPWKIVVPVVLVGVVLVVLVFIRRKRRSKSF